MARKVFSRPTKTDAELLSDLNNSEEVNAGDVGGVSGYTFIKKSDVVDRLTDIRNSQNSISSVPKPKLTLAFHNKISLFKTDSMEGVTTTIWEISRFQDFSSIKHRYIDHHNHESYMLDTYLNSSYTYYIRVKKFRGLFSSSWSNSKSFMVENLLGYINAGLIDLSIESSYNIDGVSLNPGFKIIYRTHPYDNVVTTGVYNQLNKIMVKLHEFVLDKKDVVFEDVVFSNSEKTFKLPVGLLKPDTNYEISCYLFNNELKSNVTVRRFKTKSNDSSIIKVGNMSHYLTNVVVAQNDLSHNVVVLTGNTTDYTNPINETFIFNKRNGSFKHFYRDGGSVPLGSSCLLLRNNEVIIVGGGPTGEPSKTVYSYDISTNNRLQLSNMSYTSMGGASSCNVYREYNAGVLCGGIDINGNATNNYVRIEKDSMEDTPSYLSGYQLPIYVYDHAMTGINFNGYSSILLTGGMYTETYGGTVVRSNRVYLFRDSKWVRLKDLPFTITGHKSILIDEPYVILMGGVKLSRDGTRNDANEHLVDKNIYLYNYYTGEVERLLESDTGRYSGAFKDRFGDVIFFGGEDSDDVSAGLGSVRSGIFKLTL